LRNRAFYLRELVVNLCATVIWLGCANTLLAVDWHLDVLEQPGAQVKYTSLKVDNQGNVHVAYMIDDGNRYPLRYALWDHAVKQWFTMTVDLNIGTCSLTLDSKQHPHISYTDFAGGRLRYAHWDGITWKTEVLPINSDNINYYQSIALTADDRPTISFYEYQGPKGTDFRIRLRTVMWNGKFWELRTVDSDEGSGKFNAMMVDRQDRLHLAYANVSAGTGGMRYALWDGKTWNLEILEGERENNGHGVGWSCNIAVDKQGNPHLTYVDETIKLLKYAVRRGDGKWQIYTIDKLGGIGYPDRNSIALDDNGRPYIGYFDAAKGALKLAHSDGQRWIIEMVDTDGAGFTSSMQIEKGSIWISYADVANGGLKVARRQLASATTVGTSAAAEAGQLKK
jgi:hypothetical protein